MKRDRISVWIARDEEAAEGAIGEGGKNGAAPHYNQFVKFIGVIARDP
jgi:hypothetical protein